MKDNLVKFLPYIVGITIGWLLMSPPLWFRSMGVFGYLILVLLCGAALVSFFAIIILANLPADVQLTPDPGASTGGLDELMVRIVALGFVTAGPPLQVKIAPPALFVPYMNEAWGTYAMLYRTGTVPPKTMHEFVTILDDEKGSLTTLAEVKGDVLPSEKKIRKQIFPGASVEELFEYHCEAVTHLHNQGLFRRSVSAETVIPDMKKSFARSRARFLSSPLWNTLVVVYRIKSGKVPHLGSIMSQEDGGTRSVVSV